MIYFSIIGFNDCKIDKSAPHATGGATLKTFMAFRDEIDKVYLFYTKTGEAKDEDLIKACELNGKEMKREKRNIELTNIELSFVPSPIDYKIVYNEMHAKIIELMTTHKILDEEKIINISSGTPTMTACWVLLQQSGIIPKAKLIQAYPPHYQRKTKVPVEVVDFDIKDFPQIKNRDVLKQQLQNQIVKVEKMEEQISLSEIHNKFPAFIGRSSALTKVKEEILRLSGTDSHVLILGEPGTGKELVANALHQFSNRKKNPFKTVNYAGKPENLIESELFGHTKGAFTDAKSARKGLFRSADKGTVFIDEIGDLPKGIQERLLRVIEYGDVIPEGMDEVIKVNVRIVAGTNQDIPAKVKRGAFKIDFLTRLTSLIEIPPLRHRKEDIPELIQHFGGHELHLSQDCIKKFQQKNWKNGNVRELQATIEQAQTINKNSPIEWEDIPPTAISILNSKSDQIPLPELPLPLPLKAKKDYDYNDAIIEKARSIGKTDEEVDSLLGQAGRRVEANRKQRKKQKK